jgi:hypothetical protein
LRTAGLDGEQAMNKLVASAPQKETFIAIQLLHNCFSATASRLIFLGSSVPCFLNCS